MSDNQLIHSQTQLSEISGGTAILVLDLSDSMNDSVFGETTKLKLLANALPGAYAALKKNGVKKVGVIVFSSSVGFWPNSAELTISDMRSASPPSFDELRQHPVSGDSTSLVDALLCAIQAAEKLDGSVRIVGLTDGRENTSESWKPHSEPLTKQIFSLAKKSGLFIGLTGFTRLHDKKFLEDLAKQLGIACCIAQHDDSAESVRSSVHSASDTMTSMASGEWGVDEQPPVLGMKSDSDSGVVS